MRRYTLIVSSRVAQKDLVPGIVAEALRDTIKKKVDIINMSFGWHRDLKKSEYADINNFISDAYRLNILMFAAVSNDGKWIKFSGRRQLVG